MSQPERLADHVGEMTTNAAPKPIAPPPRVHGPPRPPCGGPPAGPARARGFPFTSRWIDVDGHHVHYVDEGEGPTVLFLHGNPLWSFYFRKVIAGLRARFRCVALDYPGYGLSHA